MATNPKDRFDSVPDDLLRTGAHRGAPKKGRGWITFAWAALATVVLVVAGLVGLALLTGKSTDLPFFNAPTASPSSTPTATPTPTVTPTINPTIAIQVLNGTLTRGLATTVGDNLVKKGWGGASPEVGNRADASTHDVKTTDIYYSNPADEGAARALADELKADSIKLSTAFPTSPITIVLGSDYVLPAQ
jgi:hypothetical protein